MVHWSEAQLLLKKYGVTDENLIESTYARLVRWRGKRNPLAPDAYPLFPVIACCAQALCCSRAIPVLNMNWYLAFTREIQPVLRSGYSDDLKARWLREVTAKWERYGCQRPVLEELTELARDIRKLDVRALDLGAVDLRLAHPGHQ